MNTEILEMARIACATVPDDLCEQMDISDDRFVEIRDHIHSRLKVAVRHWAGDLDRKQNDRIPFDNYADIKVKGMFFIRRPTRPHTGAGEEAVLYSVRRINTTGINSYTWKELFKNNFEYSESMNGPWLEFSKPRDPKK